MGEGERGNNHITMNKLDRHMRFSRYMFIGIILLLLICPSYAQTTGTVAEYKVKAVYLYNFFNFVEWHGEVQDASTEEFRLCILGENPFGDELDSLNGKMIKDKKLSIKKIKNISQASKCHMLYVSDSEEDKLDEIISLTRKNGILTVSDLKNFAENGGVINFVMENQTVKLKINVTEAERSKLKISSKLLSLAKIVKSK